MPAGGTRLKIARHVATMGPIGYIPVGPGTVAAGIVLFPAYFLANRDYVYPFAFLILCITIIGQWASCHAERIWGNDPKRVVIDEAAGQLIAVAFLPAGVAFFIGSFLLFRIFDIWKPWPISLIDRGGFSWSVMGDDIAAGLLARLVMLFVQAGYSI